MARLLSGWPGRARDAAADERGFGVPMALFVALIVFALGATWAQIGVHDATLSVHERGWEQAVNAAEAGVNAAMSQLTLDPDYAGTSGVLAGDTGEWITTVEPIATSDPSDKRRRIVATGYAPSQTAANVEVRKLEAEVDLESIDGFDYGLFAGDGTVTGSNHMTVNGDVYSTHGIALQNNSDVNGHVVTPAYVTTSNNSLITGDIRAGGNVTINDSQTTIQGSVFSGGSAIINGHVVGSVQAAGSVTVGGAVDGTVAPNSPPPEVRVEGLPTFTWDAANYSPTPTTWSNATAFYADWSTKALANLPFNGHHKINDTAALNLDMKWKMDADVTIVTDGKVTLSREIVNATAGILNLVVITTSTSGIEFTNNVTIPDSIHVLLFAPNGSVDFRNLKHFAGAVYGKSIDVDQNFTLTFARPAAPGFSWTSARAVHHRVVVRVLREIAV